MFKGTHSQRRTKTETRRKAPRRYRNKNGDVELAGKERDTKTGTERGIEKNRGKI